MVTTIEIGGWIEDILEQLVRAGYYASKAEAVRDAIRRLIESMDLRMIALRAYRDGRSSFQHAVEISNVGYDELLAFFLKKGVVPELGTDSLEEATDGARAIMNSSGVVIDSSALHTLYYTGLITQIFRLGVDLYIPRSGNYEIRLTEMKLAVFRRVSTRIRGLNVLEPAPGAVEYAKRNGLTLIEAEAVIHAARKGYVLVSDDARTRLAAKLAGALSAPVLSLVAYSMRGGAISEKVFLEVVDKMRSIPILVPEGVEKVVGPR